MWHCHMGHSDPRQMWHCHKGHSDPRQMWHCHKGHSDPRQMCHCHMGHSDPRQMWHCHKGHSDPRQMWHCHKGHSDPRQMCHCHMGHSDPRQMWHCHKGHSDPRQMWHCHKGCHSSPESLLSQRAQPQTSHTCHKGHSRGPVTLVTRGTAEDQSPLSQGAQQRTSHPCHKGHSSRPQSQHSSRPQSVIAVITVLLKNKWFSRVLFNTSFHPTDTSAHAGCLKATSFPQAQTATKLPLNPQQFLLKATQTQETAGDEVTSNKVQVIQKTANTICMYWRGCSNYPPCLTVKEDSSVCMW